MFTDICRKLGKVMTVEQCTIAMEQSISDWF